MATANLDDQGIIKDSESLHEKMEEIKLAIETGDCSSLRRSLVSATENNIDISELRFDNDCSVLRQIIQRRPFLMSLVNEALCQVTAFTTDYHNCPLDAALFVDNHKDQYDLLRKFIEHGADVHLCDFEGENIFFGFLNNQCYDFNEEYLADILTLLISSGCDVNQRNINGTTPLQRFLQRSIPTNDRGRFSKVKEYQILKVVDICIQLGSKVNTVNVWGDSLLHSAVDKMNLAVCSSLLKAGADGNANTPLGGNAMFSLLGAHTLLSSQAPKYTVDEYERMIEVLNSHGIDLNKPAVDGSNILQQAVVIFETGPIPHLIQALIAKGAKINFKDSLDNNTFHFACQNPFLHEIFHLLKGVKGINERNVFQMTPIHNACLVRRIVPISLVLDLGADCQMTGPFNTNLVHFYVACKSFDLSAFVVDELINAGLNVNGQDLSGATPLHYAAFVGNPSTIKLLLKAGADKHMTDKSGKTALDIALENGSYSCFEELGGDKIEVIPKLPQTVNMDDMKLYTDFVSEFVSTSTFITESLKKLGIGHVNLEELDVKFICDTVHEFFESVVNTVGELDSRFSGLLICSGSSYEGVKVGKPDEFDFMVKLDKFCVMVEDVVLTADNGFMEVETTLQQENREKMADYVTKDGFVNSVKLITDFNYLVQRAILIVYSRGGGKGHMIWEPMSLRQAMQPTPIEQNQLVSHNFLWLCDTYKFLKVSVDLNPVLFVPHWYKSLLQRSFLIDVNTLKGSGLFLIPKYLLYKKHPVEVDPKRWRVSFSHIETKIFLNLGLHYQRSFALVKSLRLFPMCPTVRYGNPYMDLKSLQQYSKTLDEEDDTNELTESSTEHLMAAIKQFQMERETYLKEKFSLKLESKETVSTSSSSSSFSDDYETVSGEQMLQTYYLKQAFFIVVENLLQNGEDPLKLSVVDMALKSYKYLLESIKTEQVMCYLNPDQNLYKRQTPLTWEDQKMTHMDEKLIQIAMCEHIIKLIESI